MDAIAIILIVGYILSGILGYGLTLAYFQGEFPQLRGKGEVWLSIVTGLVGPIGLIVALLHSEGIKHGIQFLPKDREPWPWEVR